MPQPTIAFCTTCKNRTQHLKETLPANIKDNADYPNAKFVVVDYDSRDDLQDWIHSTMKREIESGKLAVYRYPKLTGFKMAHSKNLAHRLGAIEGGDVLVNVDADNYTGAGFASWLAQEHLKNPNAFFWTNMIKDGPERMPRGSNGRIAVTRKQFFITGGYDERYETWSPDDKEFKRRLLNVGFDDVEIERRFIDAILHNDKMRFKEYPHAKDNDYEFTACEGHDKAIANYGSFGCGIVYRNLEANPILVDKVPTRIFGVGWHKTATTSFDKALGILGYEAAHWSNAHWAKSIWRDMTTTNRSRAVERAYALSDFPIPLLYKRLDAAYPNSKFVLTVRKEDEWLRSVEKHWDPRHNPGVARWDDDPFTHKVHTMAYGRRKFDADVFRERYRRHNDEVKHYFRNRPDDLLVMDMSDSKTGWYQLCGFLRRQIPDQPYPREFVTADHFNDGGGI